jgi:hypothetical protein
LKPIFEGLVPADGNIGKEALDGLFEGDPVSAQRVFVKIILEVCRAKPILVYHTSNLDLFRLEPDHFPVAADDDRITSLFVPFQRYSYAGCKGLGYLLMIGKRFFYFISVMNSQRIPP